VVVLPPTWPPQLLDQAARTAAADRLTSAIASVPGVRAVSVDEVRAALAQDQALTALGEGDPEVFGRVAASLDAPFLVASTVAELGMSLALTASLIRVDAAVEVVQRSSLLIDDVALLPAAFEVLGLRLLGQPAQLPAPRAEPSRFEDALRRLAEPIARAALAGSSQIARRVAVLPLLEQGPIAREQKVGTAAARHLAGLLVQQRVEVVPDDQVQAALGGPVPSEPLALTELGIRLGAQILVVGQAMQVGTELLLHVRAVKASGGATVATAHAMFPLGDPTTLIPRGALVLRTRMSAIYWSLLPGGGQVYNGPAHYWKAGLVVGGVVLSAAAATTLAVLAWQAHATYLGWAHGTQHPGALYLDAAAVCTQQTPQDPGCLDQVAVRAGQEQSRAASSRDALLVGGGGALVALAVTYGLGILDAALFAEDYSELIAAE
jgi:hypothetical protein